MSHQTIFGDLRQRAIAVYRVKTQSSEYLVGFHEQRGRKFVIVRGAEGSEREHVVVRDSDPRVGDHSMFELPIEEWPGRALEVATMTSSTIESVVVEADPRVAAAVAVDGKGERSPWARPGAEPPPGAGAGGPGADGGGAAGGGPSGATPVLLPPPRGMSDTPAIVPLGVRGTTPVGEVIVRDEVQQAQQARQIVVGGPAPQPAAQASPRTPVQAPPTPEVPYPLRHVTYAESVVQLLRSLSRRDKIFIDLEHNRELRERLRRALDESASLLEQIRRRDRK